MSARDNDDVLSQSSARGSAAPSGGGLNAENLQKLNEAAGGGASSQGPMSTATSPKGSTIAQSFKGQQRPRGGVADDATSVRSSRRVGDDDATSIGDFDIVPEHEDILTKWTSEKLNALQSAIKLAPWHDVSHNLQTVSMCMTGEELARWIRDSNFAKSVDEAIVIGDAMWRRRMFYQFNKKSKIKTFVADDSVKYTLEDQLANGNSVFTKMSRIVTTKKTDWGPPVRYRSAGNFVYAIVEERERRGDGDAEFAHTQLKESDGFHFSAQREDVPVPPVGDASPDECDWAYEWEVVKNDNTDGDGWRYQVSDFREPAKFIKSDSSNKNFLVRLREWQRPAMKRTVREKRTAGGGSGVGDGGTVPEEKTEAELEEEKKKEMLIKTSQFITRVPRKGTLELRIIQGVDLLKLCDSYVVVDYRETSQKSDTCPRARQHEWDFRLDVPIASDMEPTRVTIFQANRIGKKVFLGQAEVFIGAHELQSDSSIPLKVRENEQDQEILSQTDSLGTIKVSWKFTPDENATAAAQPQASGAKRCILSLTILRGEGLTKERKRIGPCGVPVPGGVTKTKCFFRLLYLGEFCDMFAQSPLFLFQPQVEFNWKVSIPLIVSVPVELQFWVSDMPTPSGTVRLAYDPAQAVGIDVEQTLEIKPIVVDGISSAAAASLGNLVAKIQWVPELDALEELIALGVENVGGSSAASSSPTIVAGGSKKTKNMLAAWEEPTPPTRGGGKAAIAAKATAAEAPSATTAVAKK